MAKQAIEEVIGTVQAVTWRSEDGAFVVVQLVDGPVVCGQTAAGPTLAPQAQYRFCGRWQTHSRYGRQFAADVWFPVEPHGERGVLAYLETFAEGVGVKTALKLWQAFGPNAVRVLENQPEIVAARGVMPRKVAVAAADSLRAAGAWQDTKIALMGLLSGRGFQLAPVMASAIRLWRARAPDVVRRNPYALMLRHLPSCGFARCDKLYLDLGNPPHRLRRQAIWIWQQLRNETEGHTWVNASTIGQALVAVMGAEAQPLKAMLLARRARLIAVRHEGGDWIADRHKAGNEQRLAERVKELWSWTPQKRASVPTSPPHFETETMMDGL